jgi:signal transduction histidine kinase
MSVMAQAQAPKERVDSLKNELLKASTDSSRIVILRELSGGIRFSDAQTSLAYSDSALMLAEKNNFNRHYAVILSLKGATLLEIGKIPESLAAQFESLRISQEVKDTANLAITLNRIGNTYMELGDYPKAIEYYRLSKNFFVLLESTAEYNELSNIGNVYDLMGVADSAMYYQEIALEIVNSDAFIRDGYVTVPEVMFRMGNAFKLNGDSVQALAYYKQGIAEAYYDNDLRNLTMNNLFMAELYSDLGQRDSSLKYSKAAIESGRASSFRKGVYESALLLSELYRDESKYDSAFTYLSIANTQKDSLVGMGRFLELQRIVLEEQEKQKAGEALAIQEKNEFRQLALLGGLGIFLVIAFILFYNNRQKQKSNAVLKETLSTLKSTQSQLIQSEKMASLGELTAGIAHEIQNPLNFVNNFSELSNELIDEMNDELDKGDVSEAKTISSDIKQNLEKIAHHGKRADAIVKGMLAHSRSGKGEKSPTDINALAEEYLKLSYHGLRAKDKSFNADFKTDFDPDLPKINVVPQDIGRVLLNLINNSFQAVSERSKKEDSGYKPEVSVETQLKTNNQIRIAIRDNGPGIPDAIKDKIFQPFFTTKPTGQGTGLGLSLSYDIVKAHEGELNVKSNDGVGTEFILQLPKT